MVGAAEGEDCKIFQKQLDKYASMRQWKVQKLLEANNYQIKINWTKNVFTTVQLKKNKWAQVNCGQS